MPPRPLLRDSIPPRVRARCGRLVLLLTPLVALAVSCGGGDSPTVPSSPTAPNPGVTITITSTGANPRNLTVAVGSRVTIVNNDTRVHDMTSDPHPSHEDCPELNQVGFLAAGQQRESGNLVVARTCGFHDHLNPGTQSLSGSIVIR
jgi:plastocyanin